MALSATVAFADATKAQPVLDSVTVEAKDATVVLRLVADRHDGTSLVGARNERSWRWHGSNGASAACRTVVVC